MACGVPGQARVCVRWSGQHPGPKTNFQMCGLTCLELGLGFLPCFSKMLIMQGEPGPFRCQVYLEPTGKAGAWDAWCVGGKKPKHVRTTREEGHKHPEIIPRHQGADRYCRWPAPLRFYFPREPWQCHSFRVCSEPSP